MIRFGSVCSGIEAASVAWEPLGWKAEWLSEIEPFPCALLAHHYPDVPNLGDMTTLPKRILSGEVAAPEVLCGGTPCQAFSFAGLRQSLDDDRGNLTLKFIEVLNAIDDVRGRAGLPPAVAIYENVPGILQTKDNAFGCFLAGLAGEDVELIPAGGRWTDAGCVFGPRRAVAWRCLDSQYFGLAQRRKRVFVVASARSGFSPAEVLFEWGGVRGDTPPSRSTGKGAAVGTETSTGGCGGARSIGVEIGHSGGRFTELNPTAVAFDTRNGLAPHGSMAGEIISQTLRAKEHEPPMVMTYALQHAQIGRKLEAGPQGKGWQEGIAFTQDSRASADAVVSGMQVRRLTPVECERLQGFPDGYTAIPWRGKPADQCPDGPRYKATGNSWAVPVARWVGQRVHDAINQED